MVRLKETPVSLTKLRCAENKIKLEIRKERDEGGGVAGTTERITGVARKR